jgi:hypothetical protein
MLNCEADFLARVSPALAEEHKYREHVNFPELPDSCEPSRFSTAEGFVAVRVSRAGWVACRV